MKECDRLSLVTYDSYVNKDFPLTYMNDENKKATMQAVDEIASGSYTNLCEGLLTGMRMHASSLSILTFVVLHTHTYICIILHTQVPGMEQPQLWC